MIEVKKEGIVLLKTQLGFENEGVLNPAEIMEGNTIHVFYRAVSKGNYSSTGYCNMTNPLVVDERMNTPILFPQFEYEKQGVEDPRIVEIDDTYELLLNAK